MIKKITKKNLPKQTIEYLILISKDYINTKYQELLESEIKNIELPGFRKGKVPKNIAEKNINKQKLYHSLIKKVTPEIYQSLLTQEKIIPYSSPKIELIKVKENEDWEIKFTLALKPQISLPNYRQIMSKLKKNTNVKDIWVPGKSKNELSDKNKENSKREILNQFLEELIKNTQIEISDLIIDDELERRLTQLVDDVRKVGLTIDSYLKSKNETIHALKERFKQEIINTYLIDFSLEEIAEKEKITVELNELEALFNNIKDLKQREEAKANSYFYASILRKQKTIDFLLSL